MQNHLRRINCMWITIDKNKNIPLARQIYHKIKHLILDGTLLAGENLPSSRVLSKELAVSRNTILEAYNQLIAEGYLQGFHGSGTVVAEGISKYSLPKYTPPIPVHTITSTINKLIDFRSGVPNLTLFPKKEWGKLYQITCEDLPTCAFGYQSPAGVLDLRQTISAYLLRTRGLNCDAKNIMIVSGSTQGLSLVSKLLYKKDKDVLIEEPTHPGLFRVISEMGFSMKGICVDDCGLNTALLTPSNNTSFVYTTPSHQYPLGGILPIQRRLELVQYAISNNCYIVEDDYDSEFRFEGQPISSLYELNPQKVIYIGTFSKILSPAIRLGYLILPDELVAPYLEHKQYSDVHTESISQYVLAKFIERGNLEKHIWKMKKEYAKKRQHLINELTNYFSDRFEIKGHAAGLHIVVAFPSITFTKELLDKLYLHHVKIYPIEDYEFQNKGNYKHEILLGYAHLEFSQISEGIKLLSHFLLDYIF